MSRPTIERWLSTRIAAAIPTVWASSSAKRGFSPVVLPVELARFSVPDEAVLRRLLGEPWTEEGGLIVWRL